MSNLKSAQDTFVVDQRSVARSTTFAEGNSDQNRFLFSLLHLSLSICLAYSLKTLEQLTEVNSCGRCRSRRWRRSQSRCHRIQWNFSKGKNSRYSHTHTETTTTQPEHVWFHSFIPFILKCTHTHTHTHIQPAADKKSARSLNRGQHTHNYNKIKRAFFRVMWKNIGRNTPTTLPPGQRHKSTDSEGSLRIKWFRRDEWDEGMKGVEKYYEKRHSFLQLQWEKRKNIVND